MAQFGGITGRINGSGTISYTYNKGSINIKGIHIGGIVGTISNIIANVQLVQCYNVANIIGVSGYTNNIGGIIGCGTGLNAATVYCNNIYNKGNISNGNYVGGIWGNLTYFTLEGQIFNYGAVTNYSTYGGGIGGFAENQTLNSAERLYGGSCSSSIKAYGGGTKSFYSSTLVMPSVYSIVEALGTGEYTVDGVDKDSPKLKDIE